MTLNEENIGVGRMKYKKDVKRKKYRNKTLRMKVKESVNNFLDDVVVVYDEKNAGKVIPLFFEKQVKNPFRRGKGKPPKLGTGQRFAICVEKMMKRYGDKERAKRICAAIGRKAYGAAKFKQLAIKGRKRK